MTTKAGALDVNAREDTKFDFTKPVVGAGRGDLPKGRCQQEGRSALKLLRPHFTEIPDSKVVQRQAQNAYKPGTRLWRKLQSTRALRSVPPKQRDRPGRIGHLGLDQNDDSTTPETSALEAFLPGDIAFDSTKPVGSGGYGDLFKGIHPTKGTLALKRLRSRITTDSDPRIAQLAQNAYISEAGLWRQLRHPNVLLCLGLLHNSWDDLYLVSPWMENGSLVHFVRCHPEANRTRLLHDAATGLAYLHEKGIIHGDVKGLNALVTMDERVALCDFGLSKLASTVNASTGAVGSFYWQSPELLMGGPRSQQADVYAFGIMMYEILSGRVPFEQYQAFAAILAIAHRDERPPKDPEHSLLGESYEEYWRIAEICWKKVADERPKMAEVVARWPHLGQAEDHRLIKMANFLYSRHQQNQNAAELRDTIRLYQEILALRPIGHPHRASSLNDLGLALWERNKLESNVSDIGEMVKLHQEAVHLTPDRHPDRAMSLNNLANALWARYMQEHNVEDIQEAIKLHREAVHLRPVGHSDRAKSLSNLGNALYERCLADYDPSDFEEAILLHREAEHLRPPGDPNRAASLYNLGFILEDRYRRGLCPSDIKEAITHYRESVLLRPLGHPDRSKSLSNLANALYERYLRGSNPADLDEATKFHLEVVQLRPLGHPERASSLTNLANALWERYMRDRNISDIEEAISLHREATKLRPVGHPDRSISLSNTGNALYQRYLRERDPLDLEKAQALHREALKLRPPRDPNRATSLCNLGFILEQRYKRKRDVLDIKEAIALYRETIELRPRGNNNRAQSLSNLGNAVYQLFLRERDPSDFEEAIRLHREAVELRPPGDSYRTTSLYNLGFTLQQRYEQDGRMADLREAIQAWEELVGRLQSDHPDYLEARQRLSKLLRYQAKRQSPISMMMEKLKYLGL